MRTALYLVGVALATAPLAACAGGATPTAGPAGTAAAATLTPEPGVLAPERGGTPAAPAWATQAARVTAAAAASPPILALDEGLDADQARAQALALADPRVQEGARDAGSGAPLRVEVFGVYPARPGDVTEATAACRTARCYRVELYNHARSGATVVMVDLDAGQVLAVSDYAGMQPDLPPRLVQAAEELAIGAPEVAAALGYQPAEAEAMMANTKTALNETACERSRHLCVAPTFHVGDRALWAIVDLTDGRLVGTRWTDLGKSGAGPAVTEARLQNDVIAASYCDRETPLARGDWSMNYTLTSSDGLRLADVRFRGQPVLDDAKLVDWHVSYSRQEDFGYSDAVGCPVFSQAAVVAREPPRVADIVENGETVGFSVTQNFIGEMWPIPCNYYYRQRFEFYEDGRFRVVAGNVGRGCGDDGMYRPVLRLGWAGDRTTVAAWDGAAWKPWDEEAWALQDEATAYTPEGYQLRLTDASGAGYYMEPGRAQFGDGGRGDDAYSYITKVKPGVDEGQSDLITIGPCCNDDHRQGPEKFMEPEPDSIAGGSRLALWYVPQMKNDDDEGSEYCWADIVQEGGLYVNKEYPCYAGPMFVPVAP